MKSIRDLRQALTVAVGLLLLMGLFEWAFLRVPYFVGAGTTILIGAAIIRIIFVRRKRERTRVMIQKVFDGFYKSASVTPALVISYHYGYPAFRVTIPSQSEMDAATACNKSFKNEIAEIFEGTGPRARPFNADIAVSFVYDGQFDSLVAQWRSRRYE